MKKIDLIEVRDFISKQSEQTKIYLGCDSERIILDNIWYADYITAIVIHIDGKHGCKLFGEVVRERDFDQKQDRPRFRLMNEVYKAAEMYLKLADVLVDRDVEVHLDINPSEMHGSNCVINEAIGYIRGTCNLEPKIKPQAFAASYAADRFKELTTLKYNASVVF
jgi:predicted RNase H-related nuclease YkuK (DUF458 family)